MSSKVKESTSIERDCMDEDESSHGGCLSSVGGESLFTTNRSSIDGEDQRPIPVAQLIPARVLGPNGNAGALHGVEGDSFSDEYSVGDILGADEYSVGHILGVYPSLHEALKRSSSNSTEGPENSKKKVDMGARVVAVEAAPEATSEKKRRLGMAGLPCCIRLILIVSIFIVLIAMVSIIIVLLSETNESNNMAGSHSSSSLTSEDRDAIMTSAQEANFTSTSTFSSTAGTTTTPAPTANAQSTSTPSALPPTSAPTGSDTSNGKTSFPTFAPSKSPSRAPPSKSPTRKPSSNQLPTELPSTSPSSLNTNNDKGGDKEGKNVQGKEENDKAGGKERTRLR